MKFFIVFALAFAIVWGKDLYSRSIKVPVIENEVRISNGQNATVGQFKYQVGLSLQIGPDTEWCGASLICKNWILTAAHCSIGVSSATVYLGATQRTSAEIVYNVVKSDIIIHPDWNNQPISNDIALIRIPTTSESSRIGIVKIPCNNENKYVGDKVVVAGWGFLNDNTTELSNNLEYAILKVSPGSGCSELYRADYIDDTQLCVATPDDVSTCKGDSGGPLVLEGQNLQIGLDSFGYNEGCAKGFPVAFTRVSAYLPWISSHTEIAC